MQLLNKRIAKSKNSHVAYFGIYIEQQVESDKRRVLSSDIAQSTFVKQVSEMWGVN